MRLENDLNFNAINIYDHILSVAAKSPKSIAIENDEISAKQTYASLISEVERHSELLVAHGVQSGDVVSIILDNESSYALFFLAIMRIAATCLPIARSATVAQTEEWLALSKARFLITNDASKYAHIKDVILIDEKSEKEFKLDKKLDLASILSKPSPPPTRPLVIVVGSGSTGKQKLIPITHQKMWKRVTGFTHIFGTDASERIATFAHIEYPASIHRLLSALFTGATFVFLNRSKFQISDIRKRLKITMLGCTVFHAHQLLNSLDISEERPLEGLKLAMSSSLINDFLRADIQRRLCPDLWIVYGANETWMATSAGPSDCLAYPGTVGRPVPGVQVQIVDAQMRELPQGEVGLIAVKSAGTIDGYLFDKSASTLSFREGWFLPGDLGQINEDGHLIFCGRSDNMMVCNGLKIYPVQIENCLSVHPEVFDVVSAPMQHALHQEIPVAVVSLKDGCNTSEKELEEYSAKILGASRPHKVIVTKKIPRNSQGKPIKAQLREIMNQGFMKAARFKTRDLRREIRFTFFVPHNNDLGNLGKWLTLLKDDPGHELFNVETFNGSSTSAREWLSAVLELTKCCLQILRIPVFDSIFIFDCAQAKEENAPFEAHCNLPDAVADMRDVVLEVLKTAFALATWASKAHVENAQDRELFFKAIEKNILMMSSKVQPEGKSSFEVLRVAHRSGIPFRRLPGSFYQLGLGKNSTYIDRSTTSGDSAIGMRWSHNKSLTAQLLREAGLPSPVHHLVRNLAEAKNAALTIGFPVVIKPADAEQGAGVTVDLGPQDNIEAAFNLALECSPGKAVLVERQVRGVCCRFFVAAGQLLYAVRRLPIGVYADGHNSIAKLLAQELASQEWLPPWKRSGIKELDSLAQQAINRQGWTTDSVPPAGQFIALRRIESTQWGGVDQDVTHSLHPDNARAAVAAAAMLGLEVAGVDIISADITQPWHVNGAIINEVNYAPLLGGGAISRAHIGDYLSRLLPNGGRIPVHVYIGGPEAWTQASQHWEALRAEGVSAYLTSDGLTFDSQGEKLPLMLNLLAKRVQCLLLHRDVAGLVVVIQTLEALQEGPFTDAVSSVRVVDHQLKVINTPTGANLLALSGLLEDVRWWWPDALDERVSQPPKPI